MNESVNLIVQDILLSCDTMLNNSSSIVSAEHISNTISLQLNHQKNICVNFFISKSLDLFEYTNPSIAHSSNSTHTCIQLEESVNTLVDNTHSSNSRSNNTHSSNTLYNNTHSIDYSSNCISRSIDHIPWNYSTSYNSSGFP